MSAAFLLALATGAQGALELLRVQQLRLAEPVAVWRVVDVDGDGAAELLTVDRAGRVATRSADGARGFPAEVAGGFELAHPQSTLLALAHKADGAPGLDLFVVDPDGVRRHVGGPGVDGDPGVPEVPRGLSPTGVAVAEGARNTLRLGAPTFAPLARDVNGDRAPDLVLPAGDGVDLWLADGTDFRRAAHVPVDASHSQAARAELLTDVLSEHLRIPSLDAEDVNGDGRVDLVVEDGTLRAYHLQAADGSFPVTPSVSVDLAIFRDTTPEASLAPGETLVLDDDAEMRSADLTGDGIPDYVIAHRRKVWVFPGGAEGPQFTRPSQILKSAEDVTTLALVELDDDGRPDLLVIKLVVPTIGALIVGMVSEWKVRITAVGYHSTGDGKFDLQPALRADLALRLPPLARLLQRPQDVLAKLEEAESRYRTAAAGDFDGDGLDDVALIDPEGTRLEVWRTPAETAPERAESDAVWLRKLVFEDPSGEFDLDRIAELLGDYGDRRTTRLTGGRASDAALKLGEGSGLNLTAAIPADVDGDGRAELVLGYEGAGGILVIEVVRLEGKR
jgi:hypothetical protein